MERKAVTAILRRRPVRAIAGVRRATGAGVHTTVAEATATAAEFVRAHHLTIRTAM